MGSSTGTQQAQLDLQNKQEAAQQSSENALLQQNNTALSPYLTGNVGFTPQQTAAMNSQALDQNAQRYGQAATQTNANLQARGEDGQSPVSGVAAGQYSNLQSAKAGDLSDALRNVTLNNAQQAQSNKFNAASVLSGNAQTYAGNVGTYGSGASSALSAYTQAQNNSFLSNLTKGLGSSIGSGLGSAAVGGLGTAASSVGSGSFGW